MSLSSCLCHQDPSFISSKPLSIYSLGCFTCCPSSFLQLTTTTSKFQVEVGFPRDQYPRNTHALTQSFWACLLLFFIPVSSFLSLSHLDPILAFPLFFFLSFFLHTQNTHSNLSARISHTVTRAPPFSLIHTATHALRENAPPLRNIALSCLLSIALFLRCGYS